MAIEYTKRYAPPPTLEELEKTGALKVNPLITPETPILFLDIDGVLHPYDAWWMEQKGYGEPTVVCGEGLFRWNKKLFDLLDEFPDVKVVLHSSWRYLPATYNAIPEELKSKLVDTTCPAIYGRYHSIVEYVKRHGITKCVILDDAGDEFPYGLTELVPCMKTQGISRMNTYNKLRDKLAEISSIKPE